MPGPRTAHAVCSHDCPDSCAILVTINESGVATRVQGDPDHSVTRGFLCGKVAKYLDRVYSPSRLLYPMRRRAAAPKGRTPNARDAEAFERISWDEALDIIAERLRLIAQEHGPESILPYSYAGNMGVLGYGSMDRRFFHRLGASQLDRTICATTGADAIMSVYGSRLGTDPEHFRHARYIIAWAANIHGNNVHLWPFVEEARRQGARLVVIDPFLTRTARVADWHIPIQPGTDAALALGLMHVIIKEGLYDRDYVAKHTHGFEPLREHVAPYTPEHVSCLTGIAAADITRLAREYATTAPAVIRLNYGVQRSQNGGAAARAVCMLPALIGAWKQLGGGLQLSTGGAFKFNAEALERPDLMLASPLHRPARIINMSRLGHALTELDAPAVKALFVYNSNPAAIAPNQNAVVRGLMRSDLFTVVHEQFFTDTTDYADLVLPATTFLEHKDFQGAYGHYFLQLSEQSIAPLGEARSNVWLFSQLGQRMGFSEPCFHDSVDDLIEQALNAPAMEGITRQQLEAKKEHPPAVPRQRGTAAVCQGRLCHAQRQGRVLFEHSGCPGTRTAAGISSSRRIAPGRRCVYLSPRVFAPQGRQLYELHLRQPSQPPEDGIARPDIHARGRRRRAPDRRSRIGGDLQRARQNPATSPYRWQRAGRRGSGQPQLEQAVRRGNNVNALTSERLTDLGRGATFYSTLVEVRKLTPTKNLFPPID